MGRGEGESDAGPERDSEVRCFPFEHSRTATIKWTMLTYNFYSGLGREERKEGKERENQKQERLRLISKARTRCSAVVVCIVTRRGSWIPGVSRDVVPCSYQTQIRGSISTSTASLTPNTAQTNSAINSIIVTLVIASSCVVLQQ